MRHSHSVTHLLHIWTSVSMENSRSVSSRWCICDHLNSGMRNMVERAEEEEEGSLPGAEGPVAAAAAWA